MRIAEILAERISADLGPGLNQYFGRYYTLTAGDNLGSSGEGIVRLRYNIVDNRKYNETEDVRASTIGTAVVLVSEKGIERVIAVDLNDDGNKPEVVADVNHMVAESKKAKPKL